MRNSRAIQQQIEELKQESDLLGDLTKLVEQGYLNVETNDEGQPVFSVNRNGGNAS